MKLFVSASLLAAAVCVCSVAHADTFTFTPTGGTAVTITTGASTKGSIDQAPQYDFVGYTAAAGTDYFFADDEAQFYKTSFGYGHVDFAFVDNNGNEDEVDGPTLFTGTVENPTFIAGTYNLTGEAQEGNGVGGQLVITNDTAVTPEPSSLALLGTGVLGVVGVARRRFGLA